MTEREVIAWVFSAALGGGLLGFTASFAAMALRSRMRGSRERQVELASRWRQWLAAHRAVHRTARSLVWTFRRASVESSNEVLGWMRAWESAQARERFMAACEALDRAECEIIPLVEDSDTTLLGDGCACRAEALRLAIEGSPDDLARWSRQLRECASTAEWKAREALRAGTGASRILIRMTHLVRGAGNAATRMVDRWSRPPGAV